jgi:hypothetical protein
VGIGDECITSTTMIDAVPNLSRHDSTGLRESCCAVQQGCILSPNRSFLAHARNRGGESGSPRLQILVALHISGTTHVTTRTCALRVLPNGNNTCS